LIHRYKDIYSKEQSSISLFRYAASNQSYTTKHSSTVRPTSTVNSDKKPHPSSHPLTALQANTTTRTTELPQNLKFQQQPKSVKLSKTLKENVDTTTTVSSQTSSHLKAKGNINSNTFFTLRKKFALERLFLDFFYIFLKKKFWLNSF